MKDYQEYYIQGSDHYLIPSDVFEELFENVNTWEKEYEFLKKASSDYTYIINEAIEYIDKQIPNILCIHDEEILDDLLQILKGEE